MKTDLGGSGLTSHMSIKVRFFMGSHGQVRLRFLGQTIPKTYRSNTYLLIFRSNLESSSKQQPNPIQKTFCLMFKTNYNQNFVSIPNNIVLPLIHVCPFIPSPQKTLVSFLLHLLLHRFRHSTSSLRLFYSLIITKHHSI